MQRKVGILGAGQLGRMLALAGYPLDLHFRFIDPTPSAPAGQLSEQIVASFEDDQALVRFAAGLDVVSFEFENVPVAAVRKLAKLLPVHPNAEALETAQDRVNEKSLCLKLGIATPAFAAVESEQQLKSALGVIGTPSILKTRRLGYDGKGQAILKDPQDAASAWQSVGGAPSVLESFVHFDRELSLIAARSESGEIAFYPLVENHHRHGILRKSIAPAPRVSPALQKNAEETSRRILEELKYVGVLAIEFFEKDGKLLFNEMAPRVHNTGHWTIEGAETSQFENHLRAVTGMPIGSTKLRGFSCMLNFIGALPDTTQLLKIPGCHVHLYGKEPRRGRKIGHCTLLADSHQELMERVALAEKLVQDDG
ncbi:MAG: 5-(carboxyamino)imidazole ribonucleotide synthase [Deltaproteobacteria bacterium]|nr:5-(carboxyamino)imidazole ribonucleotide synthase [Deltaproteobacteria bacterium]